MYENNRCKRAFLPGTCVKFTGEAQTAQNWNSDEVEQLVKILETGSFQVIWHS